MTIADNAAKAINPTKSSPFANYDNIALADVLGELDAEIEAQKARQDEARKEMAGRQLSAIESARFVVVRAVAVMRTFDSKAVKAEMGEDWYEARTKPGKRTTYTVITKDQPPAPADARAAAEALFRR